MNDLISRQAVIDSVTKYCTQYDLRELLADIDCMPSAQPTLYGYPIRHLAYIARVMEKEGVTAEYAVRTFDDIGRAIKMIMEEAREIAEKRIFDGFN